jgi:protoporphyrin/coproporphyrin ferrochelatase
VTEIARTGVLLINLGTPSVPTPRAVGQFLAEFLSDRHVVPIYPWLWRPFLHNVVVPLRAKRSAKLYQTIWTDAGSPLAVYSKKLVEKLQLNLGNTFKVVLAMRYGEPGVQRVLPQLLDDNELKSLIVLPLYPQYSLATTGSCLDVIANNVDPQHAGCVSFIPPYFAQEYYIDALAATIRDYWLKHGSNAYLLFSFHGLPQRAIKRGDPYAQHCSVTSNLLAKKLALSSEQYHVVFQSRFGKTKWLKPDCATLLQQLARQGKKNVAIICPGFAVECLETLEEIAHRYRFLFLRAGGESFHYISALNDSVQHIELLSSLVKSHVGANHLNKNSHGFKYLIRELQLP